MTEKSQQPEHIFSVATDKQSVANVLVALCEEILKDIKNDEQDAPGSTS